MRRSKIADGVFLTALPEGHFKTCGIAIHFILPSERKTATEYALLPLLLERGNADCPDMTLLSRRLASLYGADLSADSSVLGENRVVSLFISGLQDRFALGGESLTEQYAEILFGSAFRPHLTEKGTFFCRETAIEKEKLREAIESELNNKREYCIHQARRRFFGRARAGIERLGYAGDLDSLTPSLLADAYKDMLRTSQIEVIAGGAVARAVRNVLLKYLHGLRRDPAGVRPGTAVPSHRPVRLSETVDSVQAKYCMLFTAARPFRAEELSAAQIAGLILGGLPTSRLFMNVRERLGLCYYCTASIQWLTGLLCVDSGIDPENEYRFRRSVLAEIKTLQTVPVGDTELGQAKLACISAMDSVGDSISAEEQWSRAEILRGTFRTTKQAADQIRAVTADQVREVMRLFTLSVCALVSNGGGRA